MVLVVSGVLRAVLIADHDPDVLGAGDPAAGDRYGHDVIADAPEETASLVAGWLESALAGPG